MSEHKIHDAASVKRALQPLTWEAKDELQRAYQRAMCNLQALQQLTEQLDLDAADGPGGALIVEHFIAIAALDALKLSKLGEAL